MLRAFLVALIFASTASAAAPRVFEISYAPRWRAPLFAQHRPGPGNPDGKQPEETGKPRRPGPGSEGSEESQPGPSHDYAEKQEAPEKRVIDGWFGRGFGISIYAGFYPVLVGVGVGLELAMPVHQQVSIIARAALSASLHFEGQLYDIGARIYFDRKKNFSWYVDAAIRIAYGRAVSNWGDTLDEPKRTYGLGGIANLGFELGSKHVRFFMELTINGVDFAEVQRDLLLLWGTNVGVRFYIG